MEYDSLCRNQNQIKKERERETIKKPICQKICISLKIK